MTRSQVTKEISDTQTGANITGKSDRQTNRVEKSSVTDEPKSDIRIVFRTNSKSYLDKLIPEQYRSNSDCESPNAMFTIELSNRAYVAFRIKPAPQAIILNITVLEKISCLWWMIIPTLSGAPELVTLVNRAPTALFPALKQIIHNCGHMNDYSLHDPFYDLEDSGPPPTIGILEKKYLKPTVGISRVVQYLESEKNGTVEGSWLLQERDKVIIRFLTEVIRWTNAPHNPYNGQKFGREEMKVNLLLLSSELEWFRDREKRREKEDRVQEGRMRTMRRRGRGEGDGNTGEEDNMEGGIRRKRIRNE